VSCAFQGEDAATIVAQIEEEKNLGEEEEEEEEEKEEDREPEWEEQGKAATAKGSVPYNVKNQGGRGKIGNQNGRNRTRLLLPKVVCPIM
jgi:hypothetical protein